jgi:predicted glycosyltransferase involved in capsule biosynthesis
MDQAKMPRLSLIVAVLDSHEVVRRQLLHFERVLTSDCELILVDDGSTPALTAVCTGVRPSFDLRLHLTNDQRPWTQPKARNLGASAARADRLLFFDIDHIVTRDVLDRAIAYRGDKMHWLRRPAVLDPDGRIITDRQVLVENGMTDDRPSIHANSFLITRSLFHRLGGYDERFCGRYGGDDIDFNARYDQLCASGLAQPVDVVGEGYVYPDPGRDVKKLFHKLRRDA